MGTPANIIIQERDKSCSKEDKLLLYVKMDGYFYNKYGVINNIIKAYNNKKRIYETFFYLNFEEENIQSMLNNYVRGFVGYAASSIIHVSNQNYMPVSVLGYKEYEEVGYFYDYAYTYFIEILREDDKDGDRIWEITLSKLNHIASFDSITRTAKEWDKWCKINIALESLLSTGLRECYDYDQKTVKRDVAESILFNCINLNILEDLYLNIGPCPCDVCVARAPCVQHHKDINQKSQRKITNKCEAKSVYEDNCMEYLPKTFDCDKMMQELLIIAAKHQRD